MNESRICPDKVSLVAYLYDEVEPVERWRIDQHLATCAACAAEIEGLRGVRTRLVEWKPPDEALGFRLVREPSVVPLRRAWWQAPAWAQAAAAVLLLAAAAAVANLEVRYGRDGLTVRTGWQKASAPVLQSAGVPGPAALASASPWRTDLAALEQQLRREFAESAGITRVSTVTPAPMAAFTEAQLMRRVEALIQASEQRQQRELALGLLRVNKDVQSQRRLDLVRIQQGLEQMENRTGVEVIQNRQMLNYLMQVSQKK